MTGSFILRPRGPGIRTPTRW